jgi:hypothetical protein
MRNADQNPFLITESHRERKSFLVDLPLTQQGSKQRQ